MKKNFSDYLIALSVIACSIVLLVALTYALSGRRANKSDRVVEIDYPDVTGIKLHSQVRYAGAMAGSVTHIRLLTFEEREAAPTAQQKKNAVRITVTLLKDVPPIPSDSKASLAAETLLSEKFVAFSAGSPEAPKLANGAVIQGNSGGGLDGLFETVGTLADSLPSLLKTAEDLLHGIDPLLKKTSEAVDTVKVGVNEIVPRTTALLENLKATSTSADTALKRVDKLVDNVQGPIKTDLEELKEALVKMQQALGSANQLIGRTDKNLDNRMQELGIVLQNLKVATTYAKALTQALGERPNRLIFSGKPQKLYGEDDIVRSPKPLPGIKP